jgi:hypothetical protein
MLHPSCKFDHLGLTVDLKSRTFSAPAVKVQKLRSLAL